MHRMTDVGLITSRSQIPRLRPRTFLRKYGDFARDDTGGGEALFTFLCVYGLTKGAGYGKVVFGKFVRVYLLVCLISAGYVGGNRLKMGH